MAYPYHNQQPDELHIFIPPYANQPVAVYQAPKHHFTPPFVPAPEVPSLASMIRRPFSTLMDFLPQPHVPGPFHYLHQPQFHPHHPHHAPHPYQHPYHHSVPNFHPPQPPVPYGVHHPPAPAPPPVHHYPPMPVPDIYRAQPVPHHYPHRQPSPSPSRPVTPTPPAYPPPYDPRRASTPVPPTPPPASEKPRLSVDNRLLSTPTATTTTPSKTTGPNRAATISGVPQGLRESDNDAPSETTTSRPSMHTRATTTDDAHAIARIEQQLTGLQLQMEAQFFNVHTNISHLNIANQAMAHAKYPSHYLMMPVADEEYNFLTKKFRILVPCEEPHYNQQGQIVGLHFTSHDGFLITKPDQFIKKHGKALYMMQSVIKTLALAGTGALAVLNIPISLQPVQELVDRSEKNLRYLREMDKNLSKLPKLKDTEINVVLDSVEQREAMQEILTMSQQEMNGGRRFDPCAGLEKLPMANGVRKVKWVCHDCLKLTVLPNQQRENNSVQPFIHQLSLQELTNLRLDRDLERVDLFGVAAMSVYARHLTSSKYLKQAKMHVSNDLCRKSARYNPENIKTLRAALGEVVVALISSPRIYKAEFTDQEPSSKNLSSRASPSFRANYSTNFFSPLCLIFRPSKLTHIAIRGFPDILIHAAQAKEYDPSFDPRTPIPFNNHLQDLEIQGAIIGTESVGVLNSILKWSRSTLKNLSLTKCQQLSGTVFKILCHHPFRDLNSIESLDLSNNQLQSTDLHALSEVLPLFTKLRSINLSQNPDIGTTALERLIGVCINSLPYLASLRLDNVGLAASSAYWLTQFLKMKNCGLKVLSIEDNITLPISWITEIAQLACKLKNIETLGLRFNFLQPVGTKLRTSTNGQEYFSSTDLAALRSVYDSILTSQTPPLRLYISHAVLNDVASRLVLNQNIIDAQQQKKNNSKKGLTVRAVEDLQLRDPYMDHSSLERVEKVLKYNKSLQRFKIEGSGCLSAKTLLALPPGESSSNNNRQRDFVIIRMAEEMEKKRKQEAALAMALSSGGSSSSGRESAVALRTFFWEGVTNYGQQSDISSGCHVDQVDEWIKAQCTQLREASKIKSPSGRAR